MTCRGYILSLCIQVMSPEKEVIKYAEQIFDVIYKKRNITNRNIDNEIVCAGKELHDMICHDLSVQLPLFIEKIDCVLTCQPLPMKRRLLAECTRGLMLKVAPKATWRSFGSILVCIGLIRSVADKNNIKSNDGVTQIIKTAYVDYVSNNFTDFISSMGGFHDLPDYVSYHKNYNKDTIVSRFILNAMTLFIWCLIQLNSVLQ